VRIAGVLFAGVLDPRAVRNGCGHPRVRDAAARPAAAGALAGVSDEGSYRRTRSGCQERESDIAEAGVRCPADGADDPHHLFARHQEGWSPGVAETRGSTLDLDDTGVAIEASRRRARLESGSVFAGFDRGNPEPNQHDVIRGPRDIVEAHGQRHDPRCGLLQLKDCDVFAANDRVWSGQRLRFAADAIATQGYFIVETMGRKAGWLPC
jgi:hypothetical protein